MSDPNDQAYYTIISIIIVNMFKILTKNRDPSGTPTQQSPHWKRGVLRSYTIGPIRNVTWCGFEPLSLYTLNKH